MRIRAIYRRWRKSGYVTWIRRYKRAYGRLYRRVYGAKTREERDALQRWGMKHSQKLQALMVRRARGRL